MAFTVLELGLQLLRNEAGFLRDHRAPWLVLNLGKTASVIEKTTVLGIGNSLGDLQDTPVAFEIVKSGAPNAFVFGVTVGHTENNDLVLRDASVSRFHAYFKNELTAPELIDAGSKNGTFVGSERLAERVPRKLGAKEALRFGSVEAQFLSGLEFVGFLRAQLAT